MNPVIIPPCRLALGYTCPTCGEEIIRVSAGMGDAHPPTATCAVGHTSDPAKLVIQTVATPLGKR